MAERDIGERIQPPFAARETLGLIAGAASNGLVEQLCEEMEAFTACADTAEFAEALDAFFDKRKPVRRVSSIMDSRSVIAGFVKRDPALVAIFWRALGGLKLEDASLALPESRGLKGR